jgi:hypothetical protein
MAAASTLIRVIRFAVSIAPKNVAEPLATSMLSLLYDDFYSAGALRSRPSDRQRQRQTEVQVGATMRMSGVRS